MTGADGRITLGFNARIAYQGDDAKRGLRDGIRLFQRAEELGFQTGWVYQRHFDHYLSSPLTFLSAVAQHTDRIGLGTAIIPIRNEDPLLLAEAAGTADLLSDERLQLGIGKGAGGFDHLFGDRDTADFRVRATRKLDAFLAGVRGETVGRVEEEGLPVPEGTELRVTPHSPTLRDRIWYGAGSIETTANTVERGLNLLLGTIVHAQRTGLRYDQYQRRQADEYRAGVAARHPGKTARVALARSVLPATDAGTAAAYERYDLERQRFGPSASRPRGALEIVPRAAGTLPGVEATPVLRGDPDEVVARLRADEAFGASDHLIAFLVPEFDVDRNIRVLEDIAAHVAPALGWVPAR
ncbi:MAG: LLM class flavin-dependent oxidoreductase [Microbacterium sp.]